VLYAIGVTAVATGTFSVTGALASLAISVVGALAVGVIAALIATGAWHLTKDDSLQAVISLMTPFLAYLPARYFGFSPVLAVVAAGLTAIQFSPTVLTPRARERVSGFWVTIVFMLNAFIFVAVGMQFHHIISKLSHYSPWQLAGYAIAISAVVIVVRLLWVFGQGLLPSTNEPEHETGEADWSHVAVLAWSGMRGGVSLAAALAIPLETAAGRFPQRDLIIFLTFCVLLATLIGQGGTLPLLLRWLNVRDDGTDEREEHVALAYTAKAALKRLDELARGDVPPALIKHLRDRFSSRWSEFSPGGKDDEAARISDQYRHLTRDLLDVQRTALLELRRKGKVDNTVLRRIIRLLDLEYEEIDLLEVAGHADIAD
jgi:monovalent cation/hydrogen antiporter